MYSTDGSVVLGQCETITHHNMDEQLGERQN
jgi:hypothetical protein